MSIKVIIFDFDGTVADTFEAIVDITNKLAPEFGYQPVSQQDIIRFKKMTSREIIKYSGISLFKLPFLLKKLKLELNEMIHLLSPIIGMKDALMCLHKKGYQLGMITSNDKNNVVKFLDNNSLPDLFDFLYCGTNLFGKSKVINRFLKINCLKREEIIYVGDETRDIEAGKKSQIKVIAVSWGFNAKEALAKEKPDFLIDQPSELITVIEKLHQFDLKI